MSDALKMADKLEMYLLRKGIPNVHSQVSEIADKVMHFTTKNRNKPVSPSQ